MTTTIITTLYQGEDVPPWSKDIFTPEWADKLYRGIARNMREPFRFVCLVDQEYEFQEPIDAIPFLGNYRNMWCLLEALRPDIDENQKLFMGLDTIIRGDITHIANYSPDFAMTRDPYYQKTRCSGVMSFNNKTAGPIWEQFVHDSNRDDFKMSGKWVSDMIWLDKNIPECPLIQDIFPDQIQSYKVDIVRDGKSLEDARIVYFHGIPKPHEMSDDWVKEHWR